MSLTINGVQVGGKLLEAAADMKMAILVLAIIAYLGYRSTLPAVPVKDIQDAIQESERHERELLEAEETRRRQDDAEASARLRRPSTPSASTDALTVMRRKKKKVKRSKSNLTGGGDNDDESSHESDEHQQLPSPETPTQTEFNHSKHVVETPTLEEDEDDPVAELNPAEDDDADPTVDLIVVATPPSSNKKKHKKKKPRTTADLLPAPQFVTDIDWNAIVRPTKSSPGSTASTSSSSSSKARRSLSPVKPPSSLPVILDSRAARAADPILLLSPSSTPATCMKKPPMLARSQSSVADGRSWRDALGLLPSPPVLTKTVSLGTSPVNPPLPKDPPPPLPELQQVVHQIAFYFSEANLARDLFLRHRMDTQGYVYVSVVLNFNRVKAMTQFLKVDLNMTELIRCMELSPTLDVQCKRRADGTIDPEFVRLAKVRAAHAWASWVPANPLPTCHPFEALARRASSTFAKTA
ncbi:Aste57867_21779 [Aphanomyces stellatus]|uniref:Aste57867_21779 protein n=1 Tax=Aphanomyces stellatus TaxID=120398 RepID=A0A485LJS3_9STRA|nr:hypothetical protein As57867_021710 [Aphanomyces stellatus]VFT98448.1 Aste57867_21779 [Aphanomyces stellatus]